MLEKNRIENVGVRKRGKKIPFGTIVNEGSHQEDLQPSSLPAESSHDESSDEEEDDVQYVKFLRSRRYN